MTLMIPVKVAPFKPRCQDCKWFKAEMCTFFVEYSKKIIEPVTYPVRIHDARSDVLSCGPSGRYFKQV